MPIGLVCINLTTFYMNQTNIRKGFGSRPAPPAPVTSTSTGGPSSSTVQPSSGVSLETGSSGSVESSNALPIGSPATQTGTLAGATATTAPGMGGQEGGASGTSAAAAVQSSAKPSGLTNSQSAANRLDNSLILTALAIIGLFTLIS